MSTREKVVSAALVLAVLCGGTWAEGKDAMLAETVLNDERLTEVLDRAKAIVATGFNAGGHYGEVWIRDLATFIEISCDVYDQDRIKEALLMFFTFQGEDGNIIDGYMNILNAQNREQI